MAQAGVERDDRGGPMGEIVTLRDQGLGNASYLVDLGDGRGLVLDPSRDPGPYLDAAARRGLRLAWTAWGCGRWPPPATPPSIWPSCWPTAPNRWRCSPAGRCWSAPSPAPT